MRIQWRISQVFRFSSTSDHELTSLCSADALSTLSLTRRRYFLLDSPENRRAKLFKHVSYCHSLKAFPLESHSNPFRSSSSILLPPKFYATKRLPRRLLLHHAFIPLPLLDPPADLRLHMARYALRTYHPVPPCMRAPSPFLTRPRPIHPNSPSTN